MTKVARVINDQITGIENRRGFDPNRVRHVDGKPMLREVIDTKPAPGEGEVLDGPVITILDTTVTRVWTVRDKTAGELDAEKDSLADRITKAAFVISFNHENRIRVLEGKSPITKPQFKEAIRDRV